MTSGCRGEREVGNAASYLYLGIMCTWKTACLYMTPGI